jgi:UPF0042 nucleotide-binding protein
MHCFEDLGYFCIDNLPPQLLRDMAKLGSLPGSRVRKIAVVSDIRGGQFFSELSEALKKLRKRSIPYQILYLEAADEVLVQRFKETRRKHPLSQEGSITEGIQNERQIMEQVRGIADMVIDTTNLAPVQLRERILSSFLGEQKPGILITMISFGFKYGMPLDADIVMDVRFIPNPHYVKELRPLTGLEQSVKQFVLNRNETKEFIEKFEDLISLVVPYYVSEGKSHLTIAIGCTGGSHRSVAISEEIGAFLAKNSYNVTVRHKDIGKDVHVGREAT